jgi:hypothetical protein
MVAELIKDVDNELAEAEQAWIEKIILEYDIDDIVLQQEEIKKKYKKKIKEIKLC